MAGVTQATNEAELCTSVQACRHGTKHDLCKTLPGKVPDVQDAGTSLELVASRLYSVAQAM